jgi:hypothetical protein
VSVRAVEMELPGVGEPETLRARTREVPDPQAGEAVVRVEASGVSFAEQQMRLGKYYDQPKFLFVPGYDLRPVHLRHCLPLVIERREPLQGARAATTAHGGATLAASSQP